MRFLITFIITWGAVVVSFSQNSVVELIQSYSDQYDELLINSDHMKLTYFESNEDQGKEFSLNGNSVYLSLMMKDSVVWKDSNMVNHSTLYSVGIENILTTNTFKWNSNNKLIFKSTNYEEESNKLLDEEYIFNYDDQDRLQNVRSIKPNIPSDMLIAEIIYDDHPLFPKLIRATIGMQMDVERDHIGDTILFNFKTSIPAELLEMVRQQMGEDTTEAEILEAIGPMGRIPKMFSKIYPKGQDQFVEETYEENREGFTEKTATFIFNTDKQILSKEWEKYGFKNKIEYTYDNQGRTASIEVEGNTYHFEYDDNGKLIKEYLDGNLIFYEYKNNKLMSKIIQSAGGEYISEYSEYTYF